jgi:hypothetical protein
MYPQPNLFLLGQDSLDKVLQVNADLQKYGVTVELGVELRSLEQFDDRVDVEILRHRSSNLV